MGVHYVDGEVINFQYKTQYFIEGDGQKQRQDLKVCDVRYQLIISLKLTALYIVSANNLYNWNSDCLKYSLI